MILPHANLFWTAVFAISIGLILSSAFAALVVYPPTAAAALESEAEGERVQDARNAWGKSIAAACRLLSASGVKGLNACGPAKVEWE